MFFCSSSGSLSGAGTPSSIHSSKACSRSCVMKSLDLNRRYMSLAVRHSEVLFAVMKVASLGDDQFNFGATLPPSSDIVSLIFWWSSEKRLVGSECPSSSSSSSSSSESDSVVICSSSEGKTIPSSRKYERNSGVRGMIRVFGINERYVACHFG